MPFRSFDLKLDIIDNYAKFSNIHSLRWKLWKSQQLIFISTISFITLSTNEGIYFVLNTHAFTM